MSKFVDENVWRKFSINVFPLKDGSRSDIKLKDA